MTTLYDNRYIDVLAWNGDTAQGGMFDANSTGKVVTGIWRLAQRFLLTFLEIPDTVTYDYRNNGVVRGTQFMQDLRQGYLRTDAQVHSTFALSAIQARQQIQAEYTEDDPDDEKLKDVRLGGVDLSDGVITLTVQIYSMSDSVEVVVPISTVP